jgi:predicted ATPase
LVGDLFECRDLGAVELKGIAKPVAAWQVLRPSVVASLARPRPVVTIFEDAHWIDPTSRELLDLAVGRVRNPPVLLIVTFRPEFQPPRTNEPHVTMLVLSRLDQRKRTSCDADSRRQGIA